MRNSPAEVWGESEGMGEESNNVTNGAVGREGRVSTLAKRPESEAKGQCYAFDTHFVSNNPNSCKNQTLEPPAFQFVRQGYQNAFSE